MSWFWLLFWVRMWCFCEIVWGEGGLIEGGSRVGEGGFENELWFCCCWIGVVVFGMC